MKKLALYGLFAFVVYLMASQALQAGTSSITNYQTNQLAIIESIGE